MALIGFVFLSYENDEIDILVGTTTLFLIGAILFILGIIFQFKYTRKILILVIDRLKIKNTLNTVVRLYITLAISFHIYWFIK